MFSGLSSNALSADVAAALAQYSWQTSFVTACLEVRYATSIRRHLSVLPPKLEKSSLCVRIASLLKVGAAPPPSSATSSPWELNFAYVDTTAQLLVRALLMETGGSNSAPGSHAPAPLLEGGAKVLHLANGKKADYTEVS